MDRSQSEIIEELHFLLRRNTPQDFLAASKRRGTSAHLKAALECLALERLSKLSSGDRHEEDLSLGRHHRERVAERGVPVQQSRKSSGGTEEEECPHEGNRG